MTGVEPKYQIPNLRNKGFVRNVVLILPNCVSNCIGRFKLAQFLYELEKQGWSQNFMYLIEFFLPNGSLILPKICSFWILNVMLKYQFWRKSLQKNATLSSWTLFQHNCPHFWVWLLLYSVITPKSEDKYVVCKVFNYERVAFFWSLLLSKLVLQLCYQKYWFLNLITFSNFNMIKPLTYFFSPSYLRF